MTREELRKQREKIKREKNRKMFSNLAMEAKDSEAKNLNDVYSRCSYAKQSAWYRIMDTYSTLVEMGYKSIARPSVTSHTCQFFSARFIVGNLYVSAHPNGWNVINIRSGKEHGYAYLSNLIDKYKKNRYTIRNY